MSPNQSLSQCLSKGRPVLILQAEGHLPKESPSTALPGVSHNHAKVLVLPESRWASPWVCHPLWRRAAVGAHLTLLLSPPAKPNQVGQHLPCLGWCRRAVASSAGHTELQGPLTPSRLAPHQPLHRSEFGSALLPLPLATEPFSLACVSPNSLERASKNAQ